MLPPFVEQSPLCVVRNRHYSISGINDLDFTFCDILHRFIGSTTLINVYFYQAYIVLQGCKLFTEYMDSKFSSGISIWEMNLYISLQVNNNLFSIFYCDNSLIKWLHFSRQATSLFLLPFLAFASIFKLGKQSLFLTLLVIYNSKSIVIDSPINYKYSYERNKCYP